MRAAFVETLVHLAEKNPQIMLLTADLGFMALEPFSDSFPNRFINVGVAEQNMIGIATGLAEAGFIPFVYSIVTFAALRPYEFLRNGPILHQLPVRIVGIGAGFEYSNAGNSHHGIDDVGALRTQPGIQIFSPVDGAQTKKVIEKTWQLPGPIYYRIGKDDRFYIPELDGRFELNEVQVICEGTDCLIFTMGSIIAEALKASAILEDKGLSVKVVSVSSLNPAPIEAIKQMIKNFSTIYTLEAHYISGGLGSIICEIVADHALPARVIRFGVRAVTDGRTGNQAYYYNLHGLSAEKIVANILQNR